MHFPLASRSCQDGHSTRLHVWQGTQLKQYLRKDLLLMTSAEHACDGFCTKKLRKRILGQLVLEKAGLWYLVYGSEL